MRSLTLAVAISTICVLAGCTGGGPDLAAEGQRFLLAEEPAGAVSILDFREAGGARSDVVLFGRIGGAEPAVSTSAAEFVMSDPTHSPDEPEHACQDDNCPFCKGKKKVDTSGTAIVLLTDAAGRVPAVGASRLLPIEPGQLVVVRGAAEVNAIGQLVVRAKGLYVRR
ncbi:MAG: hypothetical protein SFU86_09155 [Pirellulaceae bacterium]|nr:hypothetical protein [Pirellulaceae bacterium]